ncbi:hypothetical protein EPUS_00780 [Endocarpon pusillum Z07020]|uniref:C2H2-type domain-containing protein n=1 Tax=Endocarpon pusillum (strain Z07020 / HMAS-L-300199) TaxID=1263415 RepID=U1HVF0_ENDPU|nr:uncharacterized protein EPUS_00780 [Endocarpon pusillum Z07020]ERF74650.1 hypothetical protein EPUS_00780 [Endocarpon pusillum Z07020]
MTAIPIAERGYDGTSEYDLISNSSMGSDSDCDTEEGHHGRPKISKIAWLVQQKFEQIQSLFYLSSLLRRPTFTGRYLRSVKSKARAELLRDESPLIFRLGRYDSEHVFEKVRQWHGLSKSAINVSHEDEKPASLDCIQARRAVNSELGEDVTVLCHRLAKANNRRREQLQYWAEHSDVLMKEGSSVSMAETPVLEVKQGSESQSQVSTIKRSNQTELKQSKDTRSSFSKQSFSTAARSAVYETKTQSGRTRTVYAQSAAANGRSNRVPDMPVPANDTSSFHCPYCGMDLKSHDMEDRQAWKRHVFRDLRPYICTYPTCQTPEKLYVTRHDWLYHEMQMHRRQFLCGNCHVKYPTQEMMVAHLRAHHEGSFSESQLPTILDMCDRPIDDNEQSTCLLCGQKMYLLQLWEHLAMHMEDIALFVLPSKVAEETGDVDGGSISNQAPRLEFGNGSHGDGASSLDSLHFSNAGSEYAHKQTSADFENLQSTARPEADSKIAFWEVFNSDLEYHSSTLTPLVGEGNNKLEEHFPYTIAGRHSVESVSFQFKIDTIVSNVAD